jgi:Cullin family/Cullin protein neddylation domain
MMSTPEETELFQTIWDRDLAPVVTACLEPSVASDELVNRTSLATLHEIVYQVCAAPPGASPPAQPHRIYALLRAQLHIHARSVALILAGLLDIHTHGLGSAPMHLVTDGAVERYKRRLLHSIELYRADEDEECLLLSHRDGSLLVPTYVSCWKAYSTGIDNLCALFSYLDRVWVSNRMDFGDDALDDAEREALGENIQIHDIRATAAIAWKEELLVPLGTFVADAVLATVEHVREQHSKRCSPKPASRLRAVSALIAENFCSQKRSLDGEVDPLRAVSVIVESMCTVGKTGEIQSAQLEHFSTGILSSAVSGLPLASLHLDPLRPPSPTRDRSKLALYYLLFEVPFLAAAVRFFTAESEALLSQMSVSEYVREVEDILQSELERAVRYVAPVTMAPLQGVLERALIADRAEVLRAEVDLKLREASKDDLKRLYSLLSRVPDALGPFNSLLRSHVESHGLSALKSWTSHAPVMTPRQSSMCSTSGSLVVSSTSSKAQDDPCFICGGNIETSASPDGGLVREGCCAQSTRAAGFVTTAWYVYERYSKIVDESFGSARDSANALEQGCERFLNSACGAPELLAQFCHEILEQHLQPQIGGSPAGISSRLLAACNLTETGALVWMERVTRLFRFLNDKDMFQRVYAFKLARRLVYRTCVSRTVEESMIVLLRNTCGIDYTSRLQRMFDDVQSSADESLSFRNARETGSISLDDPADRDLEFDILILCASAWPYLSQSLIDDSQGTEGTLNQLDSRNAVDSCHRYSGSLSDDGSISTPANTDGADKGSGSDANRGGSYGLDVENCSTTLMLASLAAMPTRISRISARFGEFYVDAQGHDGRKLNWMYHLCRVEIAARLSSGDCTLTTLETSIPQAAVLLQFNDQPRMTLHSMSAILGVSVSDLIPVVGVLVQARILVIRGSGSLILEAELGGNVTPSPQPALCRDDVVEINDGNRSVGLKGGIIRLALASYEGDDSKQVRRVKRNLETDRRQQVKACIVRIMKRRKRAEENDLIEAVQKQTSKWFTPRDGDVVAGIAALVEHEYLVYENGSYLYVA